MNRVFCFSVGLLLASSLPARAADAPDKVRQDFDAVLDAQEARAGKMNQARLDLFCVNAEVSEAKLAGLEAFVVAQQDFPDAKAEALLGTLLEAANAMRVEAFKGRMQIHGNAYLADWRRVGDFLAPRNKTDADIMTSAIERGFDDDSAMILIDGTTLQLLPRVHPQFVVEPGDFDLTLGHWEIARAIKPGAGERLEAARTATSSTIGMTTIKEDRDVVVQYEFDPRHGDAPRRLTGLMKFHDPAKPAAVLRQNVFASGSVTPYPLTAALLGERGDIGWNVQVILIEHWEACKASDALPAMDVPALLRVEDYRNGDEPKVSALEKGDLQGKGMESLMEGK